MVNGFDPFLGGIRDRLRDKLCVLCLCVFICLSVCVCVSCLLVVVILFNTFIVYVGIPVEGLATFTAGELFLLCFLLLLVRFRVLLFHCIQPLNTLHTTIEYNHCNTQITLLLVTQGIHHY
jgi:hypothetical protein